MISDIASYLRFFDSVRRRTERDVAALPSAAAAWRPPAIGGETGWSIGQIVIHIGGSRLYFASAYRDEGWIWTKAEADPDDQRTWLPWLQSSAERFAALVRETPADWLTRRIEMIDTPGQSLAVDPSPPGGGLGRVPSSQFGDMARSLAVALDELGIGEHERVAIVSPNAARFLVSLFGVSVFGRVLVPINFRLNAEEIRYIIEHSGSSVLLVDPELDEPLRHIPVKHRFVLGTGTDPQLFLRTGAAPRLQVTDENATVSINYTSGTTARPKGVQLTHRNFWLNAVAFGWHLAMTDRDVYLHTLPTFHCNGWGMPYAVTGMGVRQVIIRKIDGEEILRRVEAEGVTLFNCAPAVIAAVLDAAAVRRQTGVAVPGRGRVRVVVAGAPPPSKTIERVETELGWEFIQIYGLTETAPLLTFNPAPPEWDGPDAAGRSRRLSRAGGPPG